MNTNDIKIQSLHSDISEKKVVAACADNIVRVYKVENDGIKLSEELRGHSAIVTKALFINQGEIIISADFSGKLVLWKCEGYQFVKRLEISASQSPIYDISTVFNDSQIKVYCACNSGILKTITIDTNFNYKEESKELHRYSIASVSSNSEYIITGSLDFSVGVHSNDQSKYLTDHKTTINDVSIAPSNIMKKTIFATCDEEGKIFIYEEEDNEFNKQEISLGQPCHNLSWSKTGFILTVGYGEGMFKCFMPGEDGNFAEIKMEDCKEIKE